ncbi:MAG: TerC family protein [Saprospiraceae bacterium]|nr:TerC family protein [Saprospiraceae bacterium]
MTELLSQILGADWDNALIIILNLIIIESLLSVDNAAVLATMVMDLPQHQRAKALRYGIIGAYVFRGLCLIFAAWLIQIWWLKPLGGLYLIFLAYNYFRTKATPQHDDDVLVKEEKWFYKISTGLFGQFWATVIAVEIMDLAFSLDNVFAAVAFTNNIWLICIGVFIGILAMRFVAQWFVKLLERYPFLEVSAFIVIGILGLKLFLSLPGHFFAGHWMVMLLEGEMFDLFVSVVTAGFFFVPIITSRLFGWPASIKPKSDTASNGMGVASSPIDQLGPAATNNLEEDGPLDERQRANVHWKNGPMLRPTFRDNLILQDRYALSPLYYEQKPRLRQNPSLEPRAHHPGHPSQNRRSFS